jgi:hypothetical protein
MDKGTFSNFVSAGVFGVGWVLPRGNAQDLVLSIGMCALSGGITNSLAVKMLFDRIPSLAGSGVIPARFKEIRAKVKSLILEHFFEEAYLHRFFSDTERKIDWKRYLKPRSPQDKAPLGTYVEAQWEKLSAREVVQPIIDQQIEKLTDSSVGGLLLMVGVDSVKPAVNEFVNGFMVSMRAKVFEIAAQADSSSPDVTLDEEKIIADIRANVDVLLTRKLEELDAMAVKRMMDDVIRTHLGWLVVWGNVFGAVLGVVPILLKRALP